VVELAQIFRRFGPQYRDKYGARMPPSHLAAMSDIEQCRTEVLGGQVYQCPECGELRYSYHSCQNRHCPECQPNEGQHWLEEQQGLLLPVPYFLLTFTLPEALREIARSHQKLVYGLLFRASAAAMQQLAQDPRFVGGTIGMIGVLHTWTRALIYHPHVHYVVLHLSPEPGWEQGHYILKVCSLAPRLRQEATSLQSVVFHTIQRLR
jgi:hypothetical protein